MDLEEKIEKETKEDDGLDFSVELDEVEEVEETEEVEEEVDEEETEEEELKETEEKPKEVKDDKITLEDIKKQLEEEAAKRTQIEEQFNESKKVQDNTVIIGQVDNELAKIDIEANQLLQSKNQLEAALSEYKQMLKAGQCDQADYDRALNVYLTKTQQIKETAFVLADKQQKLQAYKSGIPTPQDFIKKQQVMSENEKFYTDYEVKEKIEDKIVKKHIAKLKKDHYDAYGVELSKATDWDVNVKWIASIVKEAEERGFQMAQEKIKEKQAKGKMQVSTGKAQGKTGVNVNLGNIGKMKASDVEKALTFY